jgi:hypothetical protein
MSLRSLVIKNDQEDQSKNDQKVQQPALIAGNYNDHNTVNTLMCVE